MEAVKISEYRGFRSTLIQGRVGLWDTNIVCIGNLVLIHCYKGHCSKDKLFQGTLFQGRHCSKETILDCVHITFFCFY